MAKLTAEEREAALKDLSGWSWDAERDAISRGFKFRDFSEAFAFMTRVAMAAEQADHHPDWSNSWNKVDISLSTHSAGGVTGSDVALARKIDGYRRRLNLPSAIRLTRWRSFQDMRSGGRVVEGARLESEYTAKPYRGFEIPPAPPPRLFPDIRPCANKSIAIIADYRVTSVRQSSIAVSPQPRYCVGEKCGEMAMGKLTATGVKAA